MTIRSAAQREAAVDPTLGGLAALTDRIGHLKHDAVAQSERCGSRSLRVSTARRLLKTLQEARRLLAVDLLRADTPDEEVMLKSGVNWGDLEKWCATDEDPPLAAWHRVSLQAERARAARLTAQAKRAYRKDIQYCHKLEELKVMKREFRDLQGNACRPFTQHSTDEIDGLQRLLDGWFFVAPDSWTEDEFMVAHRHSAPVTPQTQEWETVPAEWPEDDSLEWDDFDIDGEDFF